MKKIFAILVSALMLLSAAACTSDTGTFEEIDAKALPSKLDLRDFEGKNYVTPVKTQRFGDCWAFAQAGAAEISYLFASDLGVPAGEPNEYVDFSEKYITWYVFHGITGDDVATGKVRASQVGEGFDPGEAEKDLPVAAYIIGGENAGNVNLFGDGFGPVDESVVVDGEYPYAYDDEAEVAWNLPLNAEYRNAPVKGILRGTCVLPEIVEIGADGSFSVSEEGLNAVKYELNQGRGVSFGLFSTHGGFNVKNRAAYYEGEVKTDHAVTVVGYDDDFPKESFTRQNYDGDDIPGSTPPGNGAFIIKNSWGILSDDENDDGYLYLSYYDHSITTPLSYAFDGADTVKHPSPSYDQYDLMMTQWYGTTDYDGETKTANVFDAEQDESLYQIAYTTAMPKTEVTYEIYRNPESGNPSSGKLLEKGVNRHTFAGYHRIDLKEEYGLKKGETYAVVLTMRRVTDAEGSMVYTEVFPYSTEFFEGMTVRGIVNKGESYLYTDGKWSDMTETADSLTEHAYTQLNEKLGDKEDTHASLDSKTTFTFDNYPIKAILAPSDEAKASDAAAP